jgi:hypothetical protein
LGAAHQQDEDHTVNDDLSPVLDRAGREQLRGVLGLPNDHTEAVHPPRFPTAVPEPPLDESDLVQGEGRRDEWDGQSLAAEIAELSHALAEVNERLKRLELGDQSRALADIDRKLERLLDTRRAVDEVREQVERLSRQLFG